MENKFCSNCGKELSKESKFCSNCGVKIDGVERTIVTEIIQEEKKTQINQARGKIEINYHFIKIASNINYAEITFIGLIFFLDLLLILELEISWFLVLTLIYLLELIEKRIDKNTIIKNAVNYSNLIESGVTEIVKIEEKIKLGWSYMVFERFSTLFDSIGTKKKDKKEDIIDGKESGGVVTESKHEKKIMEEIAYLIDKNILLNIYLDPVNKRVNVINKLEVKE